MQSPVEFPPNTTMASLAVSAVRTTWMIQSMIYKFASRPRRRRVVSTHLLFSISFHLVNGRQAPLTVSIVIPTAREMILSRTRHLLKLQASLRTSYNNFDQPDLYNRRSPALRHLTDP